MYSTSDGIVRWSDALKNEVTLSACVCLLNQFNRCIAFSEFMDISFSTWFKDVYKRDLPSEAKHPVNLQVATMFLEFTKTGYSGDLNACIVFQKILAITAEKPGSVVAWALFHIHKQLEHLKADTKTMDHANIDKPVTETRVCELPKLLNYMETDRILCGVVNTRARQLSFCNIIGVEEMKMLVPEDPDIQDAVIANALVRYCKNHDIVVDIHQFLEHIRVCVVNGCGTHLQAEAVTAFSVLEVYVSSFLASNV